ncbi:MAG: hypothetical protein A2297_03705, partial [Elusimicrobia bacterium RIFOXYB2_FULL_48_7]
NPAGLAYIKDSQASMMYVRSVLDVSHIFMGYVKNTERIGAFGFSIFSLQVGDIEIDNRLVKAEEDYVLTCGYALGNKNLSVGANVKWVQSTLMQDYSAGTGTFDIGVLIKPDIEGLSFGFCAQNNAGEMKFMSKGDPLPQILRAGAAYKFKPARYSSLLVSADSFKSMEDTPKQNLGLEWVYKNLLAVRLGSKMNYDLDNYTFGLGFMLNDFQVDISHTLMSNLDSIQRVSLTLRSFGGSSGEKKVETNVSDASIAAAEQEKKPETIAVDSDIADMVEKDLVQVFMSVKAGRYSDARDLMILTLMENPERRDWQKIMDKLNKVVKITEEIKGKDNLSGIMRKGLMSYLKPVEDPKDAINKLRYAREKSADADKELPEKLYAMLKDAYPYIAKLDDIPEGMTFVDYKLYQALNHIYDGHYDIAIKESKEVLDLEPENVLALKRLGSALYCLGKAEEKPSVVEEGRAVWKKAVKLSPDDLEIKEFLEKK